MNIIKVLSSIVIIYLLTLIATARADSSVSTTNETASCAIEVTGEVPGFTHTELSSYLARKMHEEISGHWHFVEGISGSENYPNRVVWSFKSIRKITKSRGFMGSPGQTNSLTYLKAEVKLFVKGAYQMTMDTHPSVSNGVDDKVLSDMVRNVAHVLFVENKPDL
jgi:hypothetical protein